LIFDKCAKKANSQSNAKQCLVANSPGYSAKSAFVETGVKQCLRASMIIGVVMAVSAFGQAAKVDVPKFRSPVIDEAGIVDSQLEMSLNSELNRIYENGGPQIAVFVAENLRGQTIEQYSIAVVDEWKLGSKGKDNGILFLIAPNDRKVRIEVGRGLEGDLTDLASKRIIDNYVLPQFSAGKFSLGIQYGVAAILKQAKIDTSLKAPPTKKSRSGSKWIEALILLTLFVLFPLLSLLGTFLGRRGGGGRGVYRSGGNWHRGTGLGGFGGGGGGFGGGGGGFGGGGGGGFSGGGASGGW